MALQSVTFTSGDGTTSVPSYLATPDRPGPHPVVLILRGVAGPDVGYTEIARRLADWGYVALVHGWKVRGTDPVDELVYADLQGGALHGFAVRTHPGYAEEPATQSFDEARRFLATHLPVTGQA